MKEISAIIRQITSSVSFLPLLDQPCQSRSDNCALQSRAVRLCHCFGCGWALTDRSPRLSLCCPCSFPQARLTF